MSWSRSEISGVREWRVDAAMYSLFFAELAALAGLGALAILISSSSAWTIIGGDSERASDLLILFGPRLEADRYWGLRRLRRIAAAPS